MARDGWKTKGWKVTKGGKRMCGYKVGGNAWDADNWQEIGRK